MKGNKFWLVIVMVSLALLVGCGKEDTTSPVDVGIEETSQSDVVDGEQITTEFQAGELDQLNTLALGTLLLEDAGDGVTPEQAVTLVSLWQVMQSGSFKSQAETDAVLSQIEGKMTDSQLAAIGAMALTQEDVTVWMEGHDIEMPAFDDSGVRPMGDLSEEERAEMRDQLQNMTPEERAENRPEKGSQTLEGDGANLGGSIRGSNFLLIPLMDLLTERTTE